jgi:predicted GIY-YIG superfamily endonuclease
MPQFLSQSHRAARGHEKRAWMARSSTTCRVATWYVYLLRCGDGTLYAGATTNVEARVAAHRRGKGARYTRGRGPLALVHCESHPDRAAALRREHEIKNMRRAAKLSLPRP